MPPYHGLSNQGGTSGLNYTSNTKPVTFIDKSVRRLAETVATKSCELLFSL